MITIKSFTAWVDEEFFEPDMAYATWIGGAIDAWSPIWLAGPAAGRDVEVFAMGQGGGFFDGDHVVFEP